MVGKGCGMPGRLASWGATCLTLGGLLLSGASGFSEDQKVTTAKADAAPAAPAVSFDNAEKTEARENSAGRQAVEAAIRDFANAFNAHDLQAVAAQYTTAAEITDQAGRVTRGQTAIHDAFAKVFKDVPGLKMHLDVQSIRFLSSELAVEDGISTMTSGPTAAAHHDRYTVTHVKQDGKWLIAGARDWAPTPLSASEQLQQLDWLVGEWVDENGSTLVHTNYHWSEDKRYLLSKYSVHRAGQPAVEGMQRVGWDPHLKQLHSWTFDSVGGFSEGLWTRAGEQWIVKLTGVVADGRVRSATNTLTRLGPDHASFQSRDRVTGGEVQPDLEPVPIVRKPPQPSVPKAAQTASGKAESKTESK